MIVLLWPVSQELFLVNSEVSRWLDLDLELDGAIHGISYHLVLSQSSMPQLLESRSWDVIKDCDVI